MASIRIELLIRVLTSSHGKRAERAGGTSVNNVVDSKIILHVRSVGGIIRDVTQHELKSIALAGSVERSRLYTRNIKYL